MPERPAFSADRKYQLLLRISHEIRDTVEVEKVLDRMLDTVGSVVPFDAAGIFVLSQDLVPSPRQRPQGVIAVACRRGFDPPPPEGDEMISQGRGIIGYVIRTGEVVVTPDVSEDPRYIPGRKRTRSEIAVPIATQTRTFGALNLESDQLGAFDAGDVEILRFIADAAATVLQRTFLHRQLMDRRWMEDQLKLAHQVQDRLLPRDPPRLPGYSVAGLCIPTFEIGGDCFDYIPLPDGRLAVLVADVSGKGIPAALFMASFRALVRTQARLGAGPAELARAVNLQLNETGDLAFVTAFYGALDPQSGHLTYVNCGHNPPLLVRANGAAEALSHGGLLLGPVAEAVYSEECVVIEPGDVLLLYTDGVVENSEGAQDYGTARLVEAVRGAGSRDASEILRSIVRSTRLFYGSEFYDDDFTLMAIARG